MKNIQRTLDIDIEMDEESTLVTVTDNETGSYTQMELPEFSERQRFNEWIGNEVYSWISLMSEELNEMEDEEDDDEEDV